MEGIKINSEKVKMEAKRLKTAMSELTDRTALLRDIENEIGIAWKSKHTEKYILCIDKLRKEIDNAVLSVNETASELEKIADAAYLAEKDIEAVMNGNGGGIG